MRTHTNEFKEGLIELGRELAVEITYDETTLTNEELYSVKPVFETELLRSIMTELDIQSTVDIPVGTKINFRWGIKVGDEFEYLDYGEYTVYSSERQEDSNSYNIIAYDGMLASMKEYKGLSIDFPCTLQDYVSAIAQDLGWTYTPTEFTNHNNLIQDVWVSLDDENNKQSAGFTYRDVLDDIAEATACNIIVKNNELFMITPNETNENLPEDFIKTTTAEFSTYGPINAVVLSRSISDDIYARDIESIEANGLYEIKISDNQILNGNDRDNYIDNIYNVLHNLRLTICDFSTCGVGYLEPLDMYSITIGETTYNNMIMLNSELVLQDGISENIHTDEPSGSETDYTKADTTDRRINQTTLIVDKQGQQIQGLITNTTDNTERISSLTQTVDGFDARITEASTKSDNATNKVAELSMDVSSLRSEIGEVTDTTVHQTGYGLLKFENINQSYPVKVIIHAMADSDIAYLYPSSSLFPGSNLFTKDRILRFTNTTTNKVWNHRLPANLRYYNSTTYDEFMMDFATGGDTSVCQVTKKVGINADRTKYALATETTTQYSFPVELALTDGNYTVELMGYPNAYLDVTLMSKNMYTSQYATKVEMNSKITQKADEITTEVSRTYETIDNVAELATRVTQTEEDITSEVTNRTQKDTELSSRITQNANSITSEVTNRQNGDNALSSRITQNANNIESKVSKGSIISTINQSAESVQINANKISLAGKEINLTSGNTTIKSTNFNVDKNGNVTANSFNSNNATITGGLLHLKSGTTNDPDFIVGNSRRDGCWIVPRQIGILSGDNERIEANAVSGGGVNFEMYSSSKNSSIHFNLLNYGGYADFFVDDVYCQNNIHALHYLYDSKEEIKKDIEQYKERALDIINNTDVYEFNYKNVSNQKKTIGFVIGDNYNTANEIISDKKDGINSYSVMGILWKAIQELQQQIEELKNKIKEMEEKENGKD